MTIPPTPEQIAQAKDAAKLLVLIGSPCPATAPQVAPELSAAEVKG